MFKRIAIILLAVALSLSAGTGARAAQRIPDWPDNILLMPENIVSDNSQVVFRWAEEPPYVVPEFLEFSLLISEDANFQRLWIPAVLVGRETEYTLNEQQALPAGKFFYWRVLLASEMGDEAPLSSAVGTVEVKMDPLILQYEPVLYLHPDERYYPTTVADFAGAASLHSKVDDLTILSEGQVSLDKLGYYQDSGYYLQFVEDLPGKNPDADKAELEWQARRANGKFPLVYYAYKMTDYDAVHDKEYIVLQYWFFYVFNDWLERVGPTARAINNHEGDWELIMVFLDKLTGQPEYVSYSAHHNDGSKSGFDLKKYDVVRREWSQINKTSDARPIVYVALGSHANYPIAGDHRFLAFFVDKTSGDTEKIIGISSSDRTWAKFILNNQHWLDYAGQWGVYSEYGDLFGFNGPPGPKFVEYNKLVEPIKWAGIDKVKSQTVEADKLENITLDNFTLTMKAKTSGQVLVSPHHEFLSSNDESKVLPRFYDINSEPIDLTATLTFNYTDEELADFNIAEQELEVIRFDEATQKWQAVESIVDKVNNIVQAVVNHFSMYSLGVALDEFDYQATGELKPQVKSIAYDEQLLLLTFDLSLKNISQKEFSLPLHFVINGLGNGVSLENPDGVDLAGHLFKEYGFKGQILASGKSTEIKKIKLTLPARQCVEIEYEVFSL
ncbi:MAG: hypothetical protein A2445_00310 [Candidatus Jacksonbacteria bacterium RIFOXYC2_FULL_44_29]|nr:MAG: hypothetical protein UW45_C0057G0003 [Parcubacteria group bacterium GW2011_GWC2_44_22]OGY75791.1 MAG: hypothetical protein A2240_00015 [Candidatus Jacksonbacteria bacterium RIFOXYA2_FULL_43_12]OGY76409.1 MAG: hypothetical protein A2295_06195 [Candidatus Jacksonbacteria bacterium RIFOXYB2_FULL_44_15]OGY78021.1 MAG: hypothetical protein A2550_01835 [Candidatus Jacksonbacteria bacterium RIFOXYD2_FULL_43_21]OGY79699.1 MAG: hypothetical protein A2445_00310 [Candidatus Jacksonbacteria bacteri